MFLSFSPSFPTEKIPWGKGQRGCSRWAGRGWWQCHRPHCPHCLHCPHCPHCPPSPLSPVPCPQHGVRARGHRLRCAGAAALPAARQEPGHGRLPAQPAPTQLAVAQLPPVSVPRCPQPRTNPSGLPRGFEWRLGGVWAVFSHFGVLMRGRLPWVLCSQSHYGGGSGTGVTNECPHVSPVPAPSLVTPPRL